MGARIVIQAKGWEPFSLATRITDVLEGRPFTTAEGNTFYDERSQKYQLGIGNDFWLHPEPEARYVIHSRYGSREQMAALAVVLGWRLGVVIVESPASLPTTEEG
jgi:hypothetical protein